MGEFYERFFLIKLFLKTLESVTVNFSFNFSQKTFSFFNESYDHIGPSGLVVIFLCQVLCPNQSCPIMLVSYVNSSLMKVYAC